LRAEIARHPNAREIVWVQERPANMGALSYVLPRIQHYIQDSSYVRLKRSASAARDWIGQGPRTRAENIVTLAFTTGPS